MADNSDNSDNSDKSPQAAALPINDVAQPGKTAPSPNSKSVILSHRVMVADPMVSAAAMTEAAPQQAAASTPPAQTDTLAQLPSRKLSKPTIQPPDSSQKLEAEVETTIKTAADEAPAETDSDKKEDRPLTGPKAGEPDEPRDPAADSDAEEFAKTKKEEAIQKLIDSKQYFLPINSAEKQRSKRFVAGGVLLSLLLVVAWADIAMDAELIQIGNLKAVTHFFN